MVRPTLTGSLGLLTLLPLALADSKTAGANAATPSAKTECEQNVDDHGTVYISPGSMSEYQLQCNADHYGGDLDHVGSNSFLGCIGVCDNNPDCIGYAYTPGNCYLKGTYTAKEVSTNVDFALNVQRNLTAKAPTKPDPAVGSCGYPDNLLANTTYQFKCGTDHSGGDIGAVGAKTFDSCVGICDTTENCIGFAWLGGNGPGECYLKGTITSEEVNPNVDFASKNSPTRLSGNEKSSSIAVSESTSAALPPSSSSSPPPTETTPVSAVPTSPEQAPPTTLSTSTSVIPETSSEPTTPSSAALSTSEQAPLTTSSTPVPIMVVPVSESTTSEQVPPTTLSTSTFVTPETSSEPTISDEPSIAVATVTQTRTVWTLTGDSSIAVATVTSTTTLWTPRYPRNPASIYKSILDPWVSSAISKVKANPTSDAASVVVIVTSTPSVSTPTAGPKTSSTADADVETFMSAPLHTRPVPTLKTAVTLPAKQLETSSPKVEQCDGFTREKTTKKLRTRVLTGNKKYNGMWLKKSDPIAVSSCRADGGFSSCRGGKHPLHNKRTFALLADDAAEAADIFFHPVTNVISTWAEETGCDFWGLHLHGEYDNDDHGDVRFASNNGTLAALEDKTGLVKWTHEDFKGWVVCPSDHHRSFGNLKDGTPMLEYMVKKSPRKVKKCAIVEMEIVD